MRFNTAGNKYGDDAYSYAQPSKRGGKENWLDPKDQKERLKEYEAHAQKFKKKPQELKNIKTAAYQVTKGDTLYPILTEIFIMSKHLAFLTMIKLLHKGVNVDAVEEGDVVSHDGEGKITFKDNKGKIETSVDISDVLKAPAKAAKGPPTVVPAKAKLASADTPTGGPAAAKEPAPPEEKTEEKKEDDAVNPLIEFTDANFYAEIKDGWSVVAFILEESAPFQEIATRFADKVKMGNLDIQKNPKTAVLFPREGVPTFVFFKDGAKIKSLFGKSLTKEALEKEFTDILKPEELTFVSPAPSPAPAPAAPGAREKDRTPDTAEVARLKKLAEMVAGLAPDYKKRIIASKTMVSDVPDGYHFSSGKDMWNIEHISKGTYHSIIMSIPVVEEGQSVNARVIGYDDREVIGFDSNLSFVKKSAEEGLKTFVEIKKIPEFNSVLFVTPDEYQTDRFVYLYKGEKFPLSLYSTELYFEVGSLRVRFGVKDLKKKKVDGYLEKAKKDSVPNLEALSKINGDFARRVGFNFDAKTGLYLFSGGSPRLLRIDSIDVANKTCTLLGGTPEKPFVVNLTKTVEEIDADIKAALEGTTPAASPAASAPPVAPESFLASTKKEFKRLGFEDEVVRNIVDDPRANARVAFRSDKGVNFPIDSFNNYGFTVKYTFDSPKGQEVFMHSSRGNTEDFAHINKTLTEEMAYIGALGDAYKSLRTGGFDGKVTLHLDKEGTNDTYIKYKPSDASLRDVVVHLDVKPEEKDIRFVIDYKGKKPSTDWFALSSVTPAAVDAAIKKIIAELDAKDKPLPTPTPSSTPTPTGSSSTDRDPFEDRTKETNNFNDLKKKYPTLVMSDNYDGIKARFLLGSPKREDGEELPDLTNPEVLLQLSFKEKPTVDYYIVANIANSDGMKTTGAQLQKIVDAVKNNTAIPDFVFVKQHKEESLPEPAPGPSSKPELSDDTGKNFDDLVATYPSLKKISGYIPLLMVKDIIKKGDGTQLPDIKDPQVLLQFQIPGSITFKRGHESFTVRSCFIIANIRDDSGKKIASDLLAKIDAAVKKGGPLPEDVFYDMSLVTKAADDLPELKKAEELLDEMNEALMKSNQQAVFDAAKELLAATDVTDEQKREATVAFYLANIKLKKPTSEITEAYINVIKIDPLRISKAGEVLELAYSKTPPDMASIVRLGNFVDVEPRFLPDEKVSFYEIAAATAEKFSDKKGAISYIEKWIPYIPAIDQAPLQKRIEDLKK